jgi:YD repeat-containing protein
MTRHTQQPSGYCPARHNRAGRATRTSARQSSPTRVRLLCLLLCCVLLLPSSMLASGPRGYSAAGTSRRPPAAPARQSEPHAAGLPDLNEARRRPVREPRTVPPVPSTRRRCPPSNRRCNDPGGGDSPRSRPTPSSTPSPAPSSTPSPTPAPPHGHTPQLGGASAGASYASFTSYSFLALAWMALNGGQPLTGLPLSPDFYGPYGGYSVTDAPPAMLPLAAAPLLNPPTGLSVTSTSDTQVTLSWTAPTGATGYRVERAASMGGAYASAGTPSSPSFNDTGVSHANSYLYRVCAADGAGNCVSPYSNLAMATAYSFSDPTIVTYADHQNGQYLDQPLTPIRAAHVTQLREAVNAVRHLAGRPDAVWTHTTLVQYQSVVSASDVQDLRDRLGEALSDLGVSVSAYTDQRLSTGQNGTVVKRAHITELRDRATRGVIGAAGVASGQGTGLTGQYYGDLNLSTYKLTRTDATVNFDWGSGSPDPSIGADFFSVRWAGMVVPRYSETYTFYTTTDDGVRLWIDGQLIVDKWVDQAPTEWSGQVSMEAGRAYSIRMEFYEHWGGAMARLEWASASQAREVVPQSQLYPCWKDAAQFVSDFYQGALARQPNNSERDEWVGLLDQAEGADQLVEQAQDLGRALFTSSEYAARNRSDRDYVSDLYWAYLQRTPDQSGWDYWTSQVPTSGRANVRVAFEQSAEFQEKVRRMCGTSASQRDNGGAGYDFATARLDPNNRTGGGGADPLSRNYNWSVPLVGLPGRASLNLGLTLSYNSLVWTKDAGGVTYDADDGWPGPGFRLGFPAIEPKFINPQLQQPGQPARYSYLLVTPAGARVELRQVGTSNSYESADSSYLQLTDSSALTLTTTDGTRMSFIPVGGEYHCYQVEDRNGNYISVAYYADGRIQQVTDTLGRTLSFNYDAYQNLVSITQPWKRETEAGPVDETHVWATFGYTNLTLLPLFSNLAVMGDQPGDVIPVLSQVGLDDGSYYKFSYNDWGQVWKATHYAADSVDAQGNPNDSHALSYTRLNLPGSDLVGASAQTDCPRFTEERAWVEYGVMNQSAEGTTAYSAWAPNMAECDVTPPVPADTSDAVTYKEFYATSGWQRGLTTASEAWVNGARRKSTSTTWTQDDTNAGYLVNPRVTDRTTSDDSGNNRRTSTSYYAFALPDGSTCSLPQEVTEYAADASTPLRTTRTEYNLGSQYLSEHLIGLTSYEYVYEGTSAAGTLRSKVGYVYDDDTLPNYLQALPSQATQHDLGSYGTAFKWRGNVSRVRHYDVTGSANSYVEKLAGYYVTGAGAFSTDAAGHQTTIGYADSFYQGVNRSNQGLPTYAYPTNIADADGFTATSVYNYDMGATTQGQTPLPNVTTNQPGPIHRNFYDGARRLIKSLVADTGAYTRVVYAASMELVQTYRLLDAGVETYSAQVLDGEGRSRAAARSLPASSGGYSGQLTDYDALGRVARQSNPTETDASGATWAATGDDATANGGAGWVYTQTTYDWKDRPLVITNPDTPATTKEFLYSGCGCAGGEVVTTRDEAGRRQRVTYDVLGRAAKTQVLTQQADKPQPFTADPAEAAYSTATTTYDALDRTTEVRERAESSGVEQATTFAYDGYGRLQSRHTPDQAAGASTTFTYNADDTPNTTTDGRGAVTTYGYNNRHLVTSVSSTFSGSTVSASFAYDAVGNRTRMDDGQGSETYSYDVLSKLSSETRYFNNLGASYSLSYTYNLAGQLKSLSDPFGAQFNYARDAAGRLTDVTGSAYAGVTSYVSNARYRAWGAVKSASFGDANSETVSYDSRMRPSQYRGPQREDFAYYADGRLQTITDLDDGQGSNPPSTLHFFSRSYTYDLAGRVTHGGGTNNTLSPFQQDYTYDEFDNMTSRAGSNGYESPVPTDTAHYTNGRRDGWTYDADGRLTLSPANASSNQRTWAYDPAGRLTSTTETSSSGSVTLSSDYDGDGQSVREAQVGGSLPATYYLVRSSALSGEVVTRLTASGAKAYTYVPAEGLVYPRQTVLSFNNQPSMEWTHRDPVGLSEPGAAYDPLGNYVSPVNPQPTQPPPSGMYGPGYGGASSTFGNADNYSTGCLSASAGSPSDCNHAMLERMGSAFVSNLPGFHGDMAQGEAQYAGYVSWIFSGNSAGSYHWAWQDNPGTSTGDELNNIVITVSATAFLEPDEPSGSDDELSSLETWVTVEQKQKQQPPTITEKCKRGLIGANMYTKDLVVVTRAREREDELKQIADDSGVDWKILGAITMRETGVVDLRQRGGKGRGYFQVDLGTFKEAKGIENISFVDQGRYALEHQLLPSINFYKNAGYSDELSLIGAIHDYNSFPNYRHRKRQRKNARTRDALDLGTADAAINRLNKTTARHNYVSNIFDLTDCFQ